MKHRSRFVDWWHRRGKPGAPHWHFRPRPYRHRHSNYVPIGDATSSDEWYNGSRSQTGSGWHFSPPPPIDTQHTVFWTDSAGWSDTPSPKWSTSPWRTGVPIPSDDAVKP